MLRRMERRLRTLPMNSWELRADIVWSWCK